MRLQLLRDILDAIEATFRCEFPDFDPFPFGQRSWIHGGAPHPAGCRTAGRGLRAVLRGGVRPNEAAGLADSFRFAACLTRERLLAIVRAAAAADAIGATR
jgi:hypothetical protein